MDFSADVLKSIEDDIDVDMLNDKQLNQLLRLMVSWTEIMQKELRSIQDIEVSNRKKLGFKRIEQLSLNKYVCSRYTDTKQL